VRISLCYRRSRGGLPLACRFPCDAQMPKKAGYNIRLSGQKPPRTPTERGEFLATMRWAKAQKRMASPTLDAIQEMEAVIGDNAAFAAFPPEYKALLFEGVFTLRLKLQVHGESVRFVEELTSPLRSVLTKLSKAHILLSGAADEMSEVGGTTLAEARQEISKHADALPGIIQTIEDVPKNFDWRRVGRLRKRDEAFAINNVIKFFRTRVPKVKARDWHELEARLVRYTSGIEIDPDSLKMRRQRARRD
jgi:hypothetical protein